MKQHFRPYKSLFFLIVAISLLLHSCTSTDDYTPTNGQILQEAFGNRIDLNAVINYRNTQIPDYINFKNQGNRIENRKALLGRVLFYDKNLSIDNSVSCASCHQQQHAFSDTNTGSIGVNGTTPRHSMRLINVAFQQGNNYFWDERANSLESQVIQPIKDHIEMGYSNQNGGLPFESLLEKLNNTSYYPILTHHGFNESVITEEHLIDALANFVRSIQSFDSKYDQAVQADGTIIGPFSNFTPSENRGAFLFNTRKQNGGAGCVDCHKAPEFAIKDNIHNNGVIASLIDPTVLDHNNTRSPTLRDLFNSEGILNTPLMHNGSMTTAMQMIEHYNAISMENQILLDPLLFDSVGPNGPVGQQLNLNNTDKQALIDFLKTLSGENLYTDPKWSNPFISN